MSKCSQVARTQLGFVATFVVAVFGSLSGVVADPNTGIQASLKARVVKAGALYKLAFTFGNGHNRMNNSPQQLFGPNSIAFDPEGNVYVTSQSNPSIKKFTHNGIFLSGIYTPASVLFSSTRREPALGLASDSIVFPSPEGPHIQDVSADNAGHIFATFPFGGLETIARMNEQGQSPKAFRLPARPEGGYNPPEGLAVSQDGTLYIGGIYNDTEWQIYHFSNDGTLINSIHPMKGGSFLYSVGSVKVDKKNDIFILGNNITGVSGNNVIEELDQAGKVLWSLDGAGQKVRSFQASNIALDDAGSIYISDGRNNCIQVLNDDGQLLTTLTRTQAYPTDKFVPGGIAVDNLGAVYVCEPLNNQVDVFKPTAK